jgi:Flp pilus assembly protein TadD
MTQSTSSIRIHLGIPTLALCALLAAPACAKGFDALAAAAEVDSGAYPEARMRLDAALADEALTADDRRVALALRAQVLLDTGAYALAEADAVALAAAEPANATVFRAKALAARGRFREAADRVATAVANHPTHIGLRLQQVDTAHVLGDRKTIDAAADYFFTLYNNRQATTAEALTATAAAVQYVDTQGAWRALQEAQKMAPDNLHAYIRGGFLCYDKYAWDLAKRQFKRALALNGLHPLANAGMAAVLFAEDEYDEALTHIDVALSTNPAQPLAHQLKAQILILDEHYDESLAELTAALAINPHEPNTLALLAAHHDARGDREQLQAAVNKALALNPRNASVYTTLAAGAERRYHFADAVAWARRAIALDPDDWQGYYMAATGLLRLGEESEGYRLLDKAFKMNKFNIWAYNMLIVLDKDFKKKQFVYHQSQHFFVKMDKEDSRVLWPYLEPVLESAYTRFSAKYGIEPVGPREFDGRILVLILPSHQYFSARTVGLPGLGALGVCFGQVILMPSPRIANAGPSGGFNWKEVIDHEFLHVITVQQSGYKVPRWFTEGISVWEEEDGNTEWDSLIKWGVESDKLLPIERVNTGFTRPRFGGQFMMSYAHSSHVTAHIAETHGFAAITRMLALYRDGKSTPAVIEAVTGQTVAEFNDALDRNVRAFADQLALPPRVEPETMQALMAREMSAADELSAEEWLTLARGYLQNGALPPAGAAGTRAIDANPKLAAAHALMGIVSYERNKDPDTARKYFSTALVHDDKNVFALLYLGRIAADTDDATAAIAHIEKAVAIAPRFVDSKPDPYSQLAALYRERGDQARAIAALRTLLTLDCARFDAWRLLAELLAEQGDHAAAADACIGAIHVKPFDPDIHLRAAAAFKELGKGAELEREYRVALALAPRNLTALEGLARHLLAANRIDDARKFVHRLRRVDRDHTALAALEKLLQDAAP